MSTDKQREIEYSIYLHNDRLMQQLADEVKAWQQLANAQAQLVQSLGGRRNHQRIKGDK